MKALSLGPVQLKIMRFLWRREQCTAKEITDHLNEEESLAHSTVQTLLRQLEEKGAVGHEAQGRTFYFHPSISEDQYIEGETQELLGRFFESSPSALVAHLLENQQISDAELERIRKLIRKKRASRS